MFGLVLLVISSLDLIFYSCFINGEVYHNLLEFILLDLLENVPLAEMIIMSFMHEETSLYFSWVARQLDISFGGHCFDCTNAQSWPLRSPYLIPIDLLFWGHLKSLVYKTSVNTKQELKQRIRDSCDPIRTFIGNQY